MRYFCGDVRETDARVDALCGVLCRARGWAINHRDGKRESRRFRGLSPGEGTADEEKS